jgi:predicted phage baseplate assembly protein
MSLQDNLPVIDDRRFDDIMAEVQTRIARYTPEWTPVWTDFNDNDPGITLAQLFAWLSDMLLYRMGKVPLLNYLKFLQLLGIELHPAEPAQAEITFPVVDGFAAPTVIVPSRTQVSATSNDGSAPVIFETQRALVALAARLKGLQAFDGYDYSAIHVDNDDPGAGFEPFGPQPVQESAFLLGFDYGGPFPAQQELDLAIWVFRQNNRPAPFSCNLPQTATFPSTNIAWEYWNGSAWRALTLLKDETLAFTQTGHVLLKTPTKGQMSKDTIGVEPASLYWIRACLKQSAYEQAPRLFAIRTNTVTAIQAETIRDEVVGGSSGLPNQVFTLANKPVLSDSLILQVDEGDGNGFVTWKRVDDFFGSSPLDHHYLLNRTTGEIRFGSGFQGAIAVANPNNPDGNILALEYRTGGGSSGNVAAGRLQTLLTPIDGIDTSLVSNLQDAYGGRDEETLAQAQDRARRSLKSKCRAVTSEDFEVLAREAANVARARALPLFHPEFPGVQVPGVVSVIVVPDSPDAAPMPSDGMLRTVCAYLNVRRLLTTEVYVIAPTYQKIEITAEVVATDNADLAQVQEGIDTTLHTYFHPLHGGEDGQGWPFGGTIYYSRVYQQVFTVPGVERIEHLIITLDGEATPECSNVAVLEGALLTEGEFTLNVHYNF